MRSMFGLSIRSQFTLQNHCFAGVVLVLTFGLRLISPNAIRAEERYPETLVPSVISTQFTQNSEGVSRPTNESSSSNAPTQETPPSAPTDLPAMMSSPPEPLS